MADYCIYLLGEDHEFAGYRNFKCADDSEAMVWAEQLADGAACEVRSGRRLVGRREANRLRELVRG